MFSWRCMIWRKPASSRGAPRTTFSASPSFITTSIALSAIAQPTGWPEAVKPCGNSSIGAIAASSRSESSGPRITAPIGKNPAVRFFELMIASGTKS